MSTGLSIRFEVGGDILKVDGYGGQRPPHSRGGGLATLSFLWRKANNSEMRCFTFHISTKETNMLVRLVWCLNVWCHFMSEVAGDFHQSSLR